MNQNNNIFKSDKKRKSFIVKILYQFIIFLSISLILYFFGQIRLLAWYYQLMVFGVIFLYLIVYYSFQQRKDLSKIEYMADFVAISYEDYRGKEIVQRVDKANFKTQLKYNLLGQVRVPKPKLMFFDDNKVFLTQRVSLNWSEVELKKCQFWLRHSHLSQQIVF